MLIEIKGCVDNEDGDAIWVPREEAAYFIVTCGHPGDMNWLADFADEQHAVLFAHALAKMLGMLPISTIQ